MSIGKTLGKFLGRIKAIAETCCEFIESSDKTLTKNNSTFVPPFLEEEAFDAMTASGELGSGHKLVTFHRPAEDVFFEGF